MEVTTVGIDLAKNVFQVHAVDQHGKVVLKKQIKRDQMATFFANLPACLVGMEACGSAHYWARKLQALGHTVKLMAPNKILQLFLRQQARTLRRSDSPLPAMSGPSYARSPCGRL